MPSCTVAIRERGMPSLARIAAIAFDAAMNIDTCRYFHCENEWRFRWKSTRREATSGGAGWSDDIERPSAAIDDAVRIVRVDDVRPQRG